MKVNYRFLLVFLFIAAFAIQACGAKKAAEPEVAPEVVNEPPAQPEVVHSLIPNAGPNAVANAHDNEESTSFESKSVSNGDIFDVNRFERPFTAGDMTYLPYVDIADISMSEDPNFYYIQIKLVGVDAETGGIKGMYGVDFDLNTDGKAEVLLLAEAPAGAAWSTDGVSLYVDEDDNVGGQSIKPDEVYAGNGFEKLVFDTTGDDPDMAWAHFVNTSAPIVEFAVKKGILENTPKFMWSAMASASAIDPARLYYNDSFSLARAGSPKKGDQYYPLNELAGFDNTCRLPAGFVATGAEPLGCVVGGPGGGGGDEVSTAKTGGPFIKINPGIICALLGTC